MSNFRLRCSFEL